MTWGKPFRTSGSRIALAIIAASGCLTGTVWWYYQGQRDTVERAALGELTAIADIEVRQIANWRAERLGDAAVISASPTNQVAARILAGRGTIEDREALLRVFGQLQRSFLYANAVLCDPDGTTRLELNPELVDVTTQNRWAEQAGRLPSSILSDLMRDPFSGRVFMAVISRVSDRGAFILYIDADRFLYPYLRNWPTSRTTAETLLLKAEGNDVVYLNKPRYASARALEFRRTASPKLLRELHEISTGKALTKLEPEAMAKVLKGWSGIGPDYHGVPVLSIVRPVPDSPWFLAVKLDSAEVRAPLRRLSWELAAVLALIALAVTAGLGFLTRSHQLQQVTERAKADREIRALSDRLIVAQEEERSRLARELHDDLSQQVAVISMGLSGVERHVAADEVATRQVARTREKVVQLADQMRRLSHELHPAVLEHAGLGAALSAYCEEFTQLTGIRPVLDVRGSLTDVPPALALNVYRIVQEGLRNVAKHASVRKARVEIRRTGDSLRVLILDEGKGFDTGKEHGEFGLGLISIKERTRLAHGHFEVTSKPNAGTRLMVTVPVAANR